MDRAHAAWIFWSAEQGERGLPTASRIIDPAWFDDGAAEVGRLGPSDGWSLVCEFDPTPAEQGDPTEARVRFFVAEAPHDRLRPGVRLRLFERATGKHATVDILD